MGTLNVPTYLPTPLFHYGVGSTQGRKKKKVYILKFLVFNFLSEGRMIYIFLVTHFVSDFLFQSREMGRMKSEDFHFLFLHFIYIFLSFFIVSLFFTGIEVSFYFSFLYSFLHCLQDKYIWKLYSLRETYKEYYDDEVFYHTIGFDQLLHTCILLSLLGMFNITGIQEPIPLFRGI